MIRMKRCCTALCLCLCVCLGLFLAVPAAVVRAAHLAAPQGPVVLTVAGSITQTNRGAFDETADLFLKYHEHNFDKAAAFDRAMLASLGMHEVEISLPEWPAPVRVAGPRLRDLVAAVGGSGSSLALVALDGFASEIFWEELESLDWIVGIDQDGRPLGLGQRGPLWVVYRYPDGRPLTADDEQRWPWATFYIEIR